MASGWRIHLRHRAIELAGTVKRAKGRLIARPEIRSGKYTKEQATRIVGEGVWKCVWAMK